MLSQEANGVARAATSAIQANALRDLILREAPTLSAGGRADLASTIAKMGRVEEDLKIRLDILADGAREQRHAVPHL